MGYTHYFYTKPVLDEVTFKFLVKDAKKVLDSGIDVVCFESDMPNKRPQTNKDVIRFNGKGEAGHETFYLARESKPMDYSDGNKAFNFCKTNNKPYDAYVVAVLILAKQWLGSDIRVSSDGDLLDWQEGKGILESIFKCAITLTINDENGITIQEWKGI